LKKNDRKMNAGLKRRILSKPVISDLTHELGRQDIGGTLRRIFLWQISSRLMRRPIQLEMADGVKLLVQKGMHGATKNFYVGLCEYRDMAFAIHYAGTGQLLFDVGANVGVYSLIFSSRGGRVVAFEPIPSTFAVLNANVLLNQYDDLIRRENLGVSRESGAVTFTLGEDATNHVLQPGMTAESSLTIPTVSLDAYVEESGLSPNFLKIDVEGFETEVIQGASGLLRDDKIRPNVVLIELNGLGARYGYDDAAIDSTLRQHGYLPYSYDPVSRSLMVLESFNRSSNTLYVYNAREAEMRVRSAEKIRWSSISF